MQTRCLLFLFFLFTSLSVHAQTPILRQKVAPKPFSANSNEQPQYGGLVKSADLVAADQQFIATVTQQFGSRSAAAQVYIARGWGYLHAGQATLAIRRFNQAWLLDSTAADVYFGFSAYVDQLGQEKVAAHFFQLGQAHDQGKQSLTRYYGNLAIGKQARREYASAIALCRLILEVEAQNAFAHQKLGYIYLLQQDTAQASYYLTQAVALDARDSVSYLNRGWLRYGQQQYAKAIADFNQALRINPNFLTAYANRAVAHQAAGNLPAAIMNWQQCLELVPARDKGRFYHLIGQAKLTSNDPEGACEALHQALRWGENPAAEKEAWRLLKKACP